MVVRNGTAENSFEVRVDGEVVLSLGPPDGDGFVSFEATFVATAGSHEITIAAEANGTDHDYIVDNIRFSGQVPPAARSWGAVKASLTEQAVALSLVPMVCSSDQGSACNKRQERETTPTSIRRCRMGSQIRHGPGRLIRSTILIVQVHHHRCEFKQGETAGGDARDEGSNADRPDLARSHSLIPSSTGSWFVVCKRSASCRRISVDRPRCV